MDGRVLLVGDSLVQGLAPRFKQLTEAAGGELVSLSSIGKSTFWYGQQTFIQDLVNQYNPRLVIIVLGTNDEGAEQDPTKYHRAIDAVLRQTGGKRVVWVGPPTIPRSADEDAGSAARNTLLAQHGGMVVFDGRALTSDLNDKRTPDGVHFTVAGSKVWAEHIFAKLQTVGRSTPFWKKAVAVASIASLVLMGAVLMRKR